MLGRLTRKVALAFADLPEGAARQPVNILPDVLEEWLGSERFMPEEARKVLPAGVATGLAWTPTGGDVLYIETTLLPGSHELTITGQLGDVMQESARGPELSLVACRKHGAGYLALQNAMASTSTCRREPFQKMGPQLESRWPLRWHPHTRESRPERYRDDRRDQPQRIESFRSVGLKKRCWRLTAPASNGSFCRRRTEKDLKDVPQEVREALTFILVERDLRKSSPLRSTMIQRLHGNFRFGMGIAPASA